jgi:hypothetical protein
MTNVQAGTRVYGWDHLLTGDVECFAHEGGLFVLWSDDKRKQVAIDPIGMTESEIERAMVACIPTRRCGPKVS